MKIHCPICSKENDVEYGKNICVDCKSKFEFTTNEVVNLIKRNKFDYLTFLYSITLPILFLSLGISYLLYEKSFIFSVISLFEVGLILIISPFLSIPHRIWYGWYGDNDVLVIFHLYAKFFKKELKKEDIGRIISFYLVFIQNVLGLIFVILGLFG